MPGQLETQGLRHIIQRHAAANQYAPLPSFSSIFSCFSPFTIYILLLLNHGGHSQKYILSERHLSTPLKHLEVLGQEKWSKRQTNQHDSLLHDVEQLPPDSCFLVTPLPWVRVQAVSPALEIDLTIDPLGWSWPWLSSSPQPWTPRVPP